MGFLARLFGAVPKEERRGIRLDDSEPWRLTATRDVQQFLRALPTLVPDGATAYFEDTAESHVAEYLGALAVPPSAQVALGTIWPRPDFYHVPVTTKLMTELADFLDEHPAGFVCSHFHVYSNGRVLLEWHDAFSNVPMLLSSSISADVASRFAAALGSTVRRGWTG